MSKKKRAIEKQNKRNSANSKRKTSKKAYYHSTAAKDQWAEKKAKKYQIQISKRVSQGISPECPMKSWENPSNEICEGCELKCSSKYR